MTIFSLHQIQELKFPESVRFSKPGAKPGSPGRHGKI